MTPSNRLPQWLALIGALGSMSGAAAAPDFDPSGVWQVIGYTAQDPKTGATTEPFGAKPTGMAVYTAKGHVSVLVTGRERAAPAGSGAEREAARAALLDSMYAYAGTYVMAGHTATIHIESAWQPGWVGTERVRTLTLDGEILTITTPPMLSPVDGKTYISVTRFKRVE
jgi:hypothetical protein